MYLENKFELDNLKSKNNSEKGIVSHSLQRGQNPLPPFINKSPPSLPPSLLVTHLFFKFFKPPPPTWWHVGVYLIVSKYFNLYKNFFMTIWWRLSTSGGFRCKAGQTQLFSMKYRIRKDKTVYYQVKVLMVNRITRSVLMFF